MDFLSSPPPADGSVLHELGYDFYDLDQIMSLTQDHHFMNGPSATMNESFSLARSTPASEPPEPRHWKARLDAPPGREGETPYLDLDNFESAEILLHPYNDHVDSETLFHSLQESIHWRSQQVVDHPPEYDDTIPRDQLRKQACVKILFKAFKSTAIATDNPGMKKPFDEERHDNARVECLCWMLLEALIRRSEHGPLLVAYDPTKTKENLAIQSFAVRLDEVVQSLREQKTICKHLLDAPYINTFIDDPVRARNRVASNRDLNRKKGDTMNLGKQQLRKSSERATTRTSGKKRARSMSTMTNREFSDEPSTKYSQSPATLYATPSLSAHRPRGRSTNGTKSSSQYTPTSIRSDYGSTALYTHSPGSLQMNARAPQINYTTSPTPSHGLTWHNTQSSSSQPVTPQPALTSLELPQSMYDNYNNMMVQTMPTDWMFSNPSVSRSNPAGVDGQFSLLTQPTFPTSNARFIPTSTPRQTYRQSPQLKDDSLSSI